MQGKPGYRAINSILELFVFGGWLAHLWFTGTGVVCVILLIDWGGGGSLDILAQRNRIPGTAGLEALEVEAGVKPFVSS